MKKTIVIGSPLGLHARPASAIVQMLQETDCEVTLSCGGRSANARSVMEILMLAAKHRQELTIEVNGEDAERILQRLEEEMSDGR